MEFKDSLSVFLRPENRKRALQLIKSHIIEKLFFYPIYVYHFGLKRTNELMKVKNDRIKWLDKCCEYMEQDFQYLIEKYKKLESKVKNTSLTTEDKEKHSFVWVCWFQGEKEMPEIVKVCIESIKANVPEFVEMKLITNENLYDYVQIPQLFTDKVKKGVISLTHFSDIIRFTLLSQYGGLWIDATVYCSSKIPKSYLLSSLFSIQYYDKTENIYYHGLTSFLIGGDRKNLLFEFCLEFFLEYQKKYDKLIDFHLINICYAIAYKNFASVRKLVDDIGTNNVRVQNMNANANDIYTNSEWQEIIKNQYFHKMNWRKKYTKIDEKTGVVTNYGYMIKMYSQNN